MRHTLTSEQKKHLVDVGISPAPEHIDGDEAEYREHYQAWQRTLRSAPDAILHQKTLASIAHRQRTQPPTPVSAPAPVPMPTKTVPPVMVMERAPSHRNELRAIAILLLLVFFALVRPAHCQFSHISTIQFQHSDNSNAGFYAAPFVAKEGTNITFTQGACPGTDCGKMIFAASSTAATAFSGITAATNSNLGTFAASGNTWDFTAANVFKLASGTHFSIADPSDTTKKLQLDLSAITTGTTRTLFVPDAAAYAVQATSRTANQFMTSFAAPGVFGFSAIAAVDLPVATATTAGAVPTPPNDATKVLLGNATWGTAGGSAPATYWKNAGYQGGQTTAVADHLFL